MKVLVLGAGGVGGVVGGRLLAHGADVSFVVREHRKAQLAREGLRIESPLGNLHLQARALLASELQPEFDVVVMACKAYDLGSAIATVRSGVSNRTAILPLLNGLAHLERLNEIFGKEHVLGGSAKMQVALSSTGVVRQLNDWQTLTFGEQDGRLTPRVVALREMIQKTGIEAQLSTDIFRDMWMKMVHLATVAGMTCMMRANVGEIVRTPEGGELLKRFLHRNADIAAHFGYRPDEKFMASYLALFSDSASRYEASMARDLEKGGQVESEQILGDMLKRCRQAVVPDDLHLAAYTHVKAYEQRRDAGRLPKLAPG